VDLLLKDKVEFLVTLKMSLGFVREELDKVYVGFLCLRIMVSSIICIL